MPQQAIPSRLRRQLLRVLAGAFPDTPQQQSARGAYLSQSARVADKKDIGAKSFSGTCTAKPDLIVTGRKRDGLLHARRQAQRFKVDNGPSTIREHNELPIKRSRGNRSFPADRFIPDRFNPHRFNSDRLISQHISDQFHCRVL